MKICLMCDLHLPYNKKALQYDVLDWALSDMQKKGAELFVFAGDFTADGNIFAAKRFFKKVQASEIPSVIIPGNSDFRTPNNINKIKAMCSSEIVNLNNLTIVPMVEWSDEELYAVENSDGKILVVMHHPPKSMPEPYRTRFFDIVSDKKDIQIFYGHLHKTISEDVFHCLQAADPDKAIGENPCITYYDTERQIFEKAYYFCPVPYDFYDYIGISCYSPIDDLQYAIEHNVKCVELRPNAVKCDRKALINAVSCWKERIGENLSLHAPDIVYRNNAVVNCDEWDAFLNLAAAVSPDRITLHVPKTSVEEIRKNKLSLENIATFLAGRFSVLPQKCVVGVENMHMTANDLPDDTRRFGYIPEECIEFMKYLQNKCPRNIGINLDVGHARNNAPFSQKYNIGAWYAETGRFTVGYHLHQVLNTPEGFQNHMPLTELYGSLISYASFFKSWSRGCINKAPVIFEIRGEGEYKKTIELFENEKKRKPFDIHSHTYYSNCGRDKIETVISTAIDNGIVMLGISDHNYGIGERKAEYLEKIRDYADKYSDKIKILCGIEISTYPHLYDIDDPKEISEYDYCLLENITIEESIVGGNLFDFCERLGMRCGIAHTDMFAYCQKYGYEPGEFFRKMAEKNIFWEMNVSYDSIHGYREHGYVKDFVSDKEKQKIIRESGVHISVGFDSHRCEDYDGFRVHSMYDFLNECGIKTADLLF